MTNQTRHSESDQNSESDHTKKYTAFRSVQIDRHMPEGPDVHIVMDNYATHKTPKIKAWLSRRPHWHVHFTPPVSVMDQPGGTMVC